MNAFVHAYAGGPYRGAVSVAFARAAAAGAAVALAGAAAALFVWQPAWASFGLAIAAAVSWALWVERHPPA